jgi:hypothetical protein
MWPKGLTLAKTVVKVSVVTDRRAGRAWHADPQVLTIPRVAPLSATSLGVLWIGIDQFHKPDWLRFIRR